MVLINFYIAGPPKRLLILTTSGPSKRFITNSGSSRTISCYIAGPPKRLLILTTSGPSKRFITNSGSSRTISILQVIGHRTGIQAEKVNTGQIPSLQ